MSIRPLNPRTLPGTRIFLFFGFALLITGGISHLFGDLLWRHGWTAGSSILMCLFVPLIFLNAVGAMHGIYGFIVRRGDDHQRITQLGDYESQDISTASVAILFPIYNENAAQVCARLQTTYESLQKTGHLDRFDFHILSDTTKPENWVNEEACWIELMKSLDAFGRIFYRRRLWNEAKKSGNIRDFLTAHGNRYRYFVVFDADSFMRGETLVDLVKLMEVHPRVGLIQTPPAAINSESLFGRLQQFANRLYAPLFTAGSNYWVQGFANYVGHNAIVRTRPFMMYCDLPQLPGKKPLGGQILSHDFVEAALMVRNHWQVWLAYDLEESYEETPQGLIEYAQRDRRWCQGNLQHVMLVFASRLRGITRLHFIFGIFAFLGGPLWLLFLLASTAQVFLRRQTGLSEITPRPWTPFLNFTPTGHALLVFGLSMFVLLIPKILALIDLSFDRARAKQFGGMPRAILGAFLELLCSTLQAPLLMLWHTQFVLSTLMGRSVNWGQQNRAADGTAWSAAFREHWKHMLIGIAWGGLVFRVDPGLLAWFAPVLAGMIFSVPFTVLTSRASAGESTRRARLFLTPEETEPTQDIQRLRAALEKSCKAPTRRVTDPIEDPRLNAVHLALLERSLSVETALKQLAKGLSPIPALLEKARREGLEGLASKESLLLLSHRDSVENLHREHAR